MVITLNEDLHINWMKPELKKQVKQSVVSISVKKKQFKNQVVSSFVLNPLFLIFYIFIMYYFHFCLICKILI